MQDNEIAELMEAKRRAGAVERKDEAWAREANREMWERWHERPASERGPDHDVLALFRQVPKGSHVLEYGAGAGRHAIPLAKAGLKVLAVDREPLAIKKARELGREVEGLHAIVGDALHPPLADGKQFGAVLSTQMLHVLREEEREPFLQELKRRVEPGGHLVLEFDADHQWIQLPRDWKPLKTGREGIVEVLRHPETRLLEVEGRAPISSEEMQEKLEALFPYREWRLSVKSAPRFHAGRGGASVAMRMLVHATRRKEKV